MKDLEANHPKDSWVYGGKHCMTERLMRGPEKIEFVAFSVVMSNWTLWFASTIPEAEAPVLIGAGAQALPLMYAVLLSYKYRKELRPETPAVEGSGFQKGLYNMHLYTLLALLFYRAAYGAMLPELGSRPEGVVRVGLVLCAFVTMTLGICTWFRMDYYYT